MVTASPTAKEPVRVIEGFLSPEKCKKLIDTYDIQCKPSTVVSANGDVLDEARTSWTYYMPDEDPIVVEMRGYVAEMIGVPADHIEGLQFLRYQKGQQYKFHYDYFDAIRHNQRVHTILVYLNDLEIDDGGSTIFKRYNMKVYPKEGRAIWFRNMTEEGELNTDSLHAGEPIIADKTKYAVNIWVRQKKVTSLSEAATPSVSTINMPEKTTNVKETNMVWWFVLGAVLLLTSVLLFVIYKDKDMKGMTTVWRLIKGIPSRFKRST
jgi:prolyl 4-hydroxylase